MSILHCYSSPVIEPFRVTGRYRSEVICISAGTLQGPLRFFSGTKKGRS
jgi:hypothetical protein